MKRRVEALETRVNSKRMIWAIFEDFPDYGKVEYSVNGHKFTPEQFQLWRERLPENVELHMIHFRVNKPPDKGAEEVNT